jgi:putative CocE/NonD family hydrolase
VDVLVEELAVPVGDADLTCDVWRPADDEAHPTLLIRTPYGREQARQTTDPLVWARQGWVVVQQDVRGRMGSSGSFDPFMNEAADGRATLDWVAAQPWSDGRVAMAGPSYVGLTQWLAAATDPPALRALAPTTTMHDPQRWFGEGGTPRRGFLAWWAAGFAATQPDPARAAVGLQLAASLMSDRPGSTWDRELAKIFPAYSQWLSGGADVPTPDPSAQLRPAIHVVGWHDLFCEDSLWSYRTMAELADGRPEVAQRLIVGPWTHIGVGAQVAGDIDYGPLANGVVRGVPAETLMFLSTAMEGHAPQSGVSVFVMGADEWRELASWPPPSTPLTLHLDGGRRLSGQPAEGAGELRWRHNATDPVPSLGGRTLGPDLFDAGPRDHRPLVERPDVLTFVGEPLTEPLTVIGEVAADLTLSCADEHDVVVRLLDVHPDGRHMSVVEHSHRFRGGGERSLLVGSTAQRWNAGHRVGLQIAASSWPRLGVTPGTELSLHLGAGVKACLRLPQVSDPA